MLVFRKRLLFWLIRAYLRKRGKVIVLSFFAGLLIFFLLVTTSPFISRLIPTEKKISVGVVGAFRVNELPPFIITKISQGLTAVAENDRITPAVSKSWEVKENGKKYTFHLKDNLRYHDGEKVTSKSLHYEFKDVTVQRPDDDTIIFTLKDAYAPFLVTVSQPIFKKGSVGLGEYKIDEIELNGNFVKHLRIKARKNLFKSEDYIFYPGEEALKVAFALGEVSQAVGLHNTDFRNTSFEKYPNVSIEKKIHYDQLVTLFYNTQDSTLSDKKVRNALSYALPNDFADGERAWSSYPPKSFYFNNELDPRQQDFVHSKELLADLLKATPNPKLTLKTLPRYKKTAQLVANAWKKLGIITTIEEVDTVPAQYQIYLGEFSVPNDPDQYALWHSTHVNNITRLNSKRIDKFLEDGRKTTNVTQRQQIYFDFQKYLQDETPASFLYFPYEYTVRRK